MRWEALFGDLEAQFDEADAVEFAAEVSDRTRREYALIRLVDRLRPAQGHRVGVRVWGLGAVEGDVAAVGADWVLLVEPGGREALVPSSAIVSVAGLGALSATPHSEGEVAARLRLGVVLRALARDRSAVTIGYVDGATSTGTIDRVGADFVEVAEHPAAEARRPATVRAVRTIPFAGLAVVRRA